MLITKKIFLVLILFSMAFSCRSQSKIDSILSKPIDSLNETNINILIKGGYIRNVDPPIIGSYMMAIAQNNKTDKWTIGQLLDSVKTRMNQMDNATAIKHNYGKDSVFIREPNGNRMFLGMGQLSFDKLVARESLDLPETYAGDYNIKINSTEAVKKLSLLVADSEHPWITGNVLLNKRDSGELKNMRIGDIIEISKRITLSKEFMPFINAIK